MQCFLECQPQMICSAEANCRVLFTRLAKCGAPRDPLLIESPHWLLRAIQTVRWFSVFLSSIRLHRQNSQIAVTCAHSAKTEASRDRSESPTASSLLRDTLPNVTYTNPHSSFLPGVPFDFRRLVVHTSAQTPFRPPSSSWVPC